ncbi:MAG: hypothetical protein JWP75_2093, partial [Frondihabitans sp.]|nr:hypothetical protein [Frondihabitans sp.]
MATETESQTCFDRWTSVRDALATSEAATVLRDDVPGVAEAGVAEGFQAFPLGVYLRIALSGDGELEEAILDRLATITNPLASIAEPPIAPVSPEYEGRDVKRGSALLETPSAAQTARPLEVLFRGPSHGNPFVDVDVSVRFESGPDQVDVGGFYDGDGLYRVRFLPPNEGVWSFTTASNARSLDGISGSIDVAAGSGPGPVRVDRERARFVRDGKTITPIGTTAYAWTHQPDELQRRTLASLSKTPFTKIRMGLFPKSFLYNSNEPERFVFPRLDDGSWDLEHFDLEYFRHLERRIEDLARLGIDAELILFHAYDRWGFSSLPASVDDRYVRYAVRRLAALPTVWWSVANEYELLTAKRPDDWERIGRLIAEEDHVGHPLSIHNIVEPWDAASDWVTHCSIQRSDPSIGEQIDG